MDAREWPVKDSLALGLVLIPSIFSDFTVKAADFIKTDSASGTTMWVGREVGDFPLQPEWKLVRVVVRLHDGTESRQTYVVDYPHSTSALVDADGTQLPFDSWKWMPRVPERM